MNTQNVELLWKHLRNLLLFLFHSYLCIKYFLQALYFATREERAYLFFSMYRSIIMLRRVSYKALTTGEASFEFSSDGFCIDGSSKPESTPICARKFKQLQVLVLHSIQYGP